jgi:hypothetical protein
MLLPYDDVGAGPAVMLLHAGVADFRDGAATLVNELPHAHHVAIPDAGHLAPLDQPERFRQLLFDFLDEVDSQR